MRNRIIIVELLILVGLLVGYASLSQGQADLIHGNSSGDAVTVLAGDPPCAVCEGRMMAREEAVNGVASCTAALHSNSLRDKLRLRQARPRWLPEVYFSTMSVGLQGLTRC